MARKESNRQKAHRFRKIIIVLSVILVLAIIAIIVLAVYTGRAAGPNTPVWSWNLGDTATWNNSYPANNPKCGQSDVTSGKYELLFYNSDTSTHTVTVTDSNNNIIGKDLSVPPLTTIDNSKYFIILPGPGTYAMTNSVINSGVAKVFGTAYIKYPCSN